MDDPDRRGKNSTVLVMQNIGHMPYEQVPEDFNRIVLDFLLRDTPTTPLQAVTDTVTAQATVEHGLA